MKEHYDTSVDSVDYKSENIGQEIPKYGHTSDPEDEKVISVRITSSVAVGRGKEKLPIRPSLHKQNEHDLKQSQSVGELVDEGLTSLNTKTIQASELPSSSSPNLLGANIEYIRQLNAKKESRSNIEPVNPFHITHDQYLNSKESNRFPEGIDDYNDDAQDVPMARKVPSTSDANHFQGQKQNRDYQHTNINNAANTYDQSNIRKPPQSEGGANYDLRAEMGVYKNVTNETTTQFKSHQMDKQDTFVPQNNNYQTDDSIAESSIKSVEFAKSAAIMPPSASYTHSSLPNRPINEEQNNPRLTTVSFNIFHDATRLPNNNEHSDPYGTSSQIISNSQQFYTPPKVYSKPSQVYSEPSKFYSEPAKIYSEPAKIYSEPAKIYSEPAKIYSVPSKFYSEPASLHLDQNFPNIQPSVSPNYPSWPRPPSHQIGGITLNTTPINAIANNQGITQTGRQPARNYEIDEKDSIETDDRSHGVQDSSTEKCKEDNCKVGYVVEGRQFKKYRVEERTSDGFIVGEYGVVRNEDGALRGVRYTADSDASPRLIHDALMKFLQLK